jgi:hypothetical protein
MDMNRSAYVVMILPEEIGDGQRQFGRLVELHTSSMTAVSVGERDFDGKSAA